jgi:hypothetical protein
MSQPDMQRQIENIRHEIAQVVREKTQENLKFEQELYNLRTQLQDYRAKVSNLENEMGKLRRVVQDLKPLDAKHYEVQEENSDRKDMYYNHAAEQWVRR